MSERVVSSQFKRVAKVVTQRVAELLGATVFVVNDRNLIVTRTDPGLIGIPFHPSISLSPIHIPFHLDGQSGEVIVTASETSEPISSRLTSVLVELVISQTASITPSPNQHELKNKFIHDLLRTPIDDEAQVLRESQILGMDFTRPRAVILIYAADYLLSSQAKRYEALDMQSQRRVQLIIGSIVSFFIYLTIPFALTLAVLRLWC